MYVWLLSSMVSVPLIGAFACYLTGRASKKARDTVYNILTGISLLLSAFGLYLAVRGIVPEVRIGGICGFGLHLRLDGFRAVYVLIAGIMWCFTGIFSREYFSHHYRSRNRYYFFNLLTMAGTVGMFLSASLYSAFIFFELMSMCSYAWVAHDETPAAMRAAETYLAVAVIGGMATLMGMFMLYHRTGTLELDGIRDAVAASPDRSGLYLIGALTASGFAAKAGMFPLHIWLPKAHPVAPAPASALLSGILTKTGIFGILAVTVNMFPEDAAWGNAVLVFGAVTMFVGALLALLSVDLKRTLACSSMSQIGFISIGIGTMCLLGEEGGLAAYGTIMHMVNHSLIKLCLFMCAGGVYMKLHKLDLNEVRGFGHGKVFLHIAFLLGACSIAGVPLGSGYISKSLLHEGLLEYIAHTGGGTRLIYKALEWLFLISGGLTAAYMTKLYVCLFIEKNADARKQKEYEGCRDFRPETKAVLLVVGGMLLILGVLPGVFLQGAGKLSLAFLGKGAPGHIAYFSLENLKGAAVSLGIGAAVYLGVVRTVLMGKDGKYQNRLPARIDLEDSLYRPLIGKVLVPLAGTVCTLADRLPDVLMAYVVKPVVYAVTRAADLFAESVLTYFVKPVVYFFTRAADEAADAGAVLLLEKVFREPHKSRPEPVGSRLSDAMGAAFNSVAALMNRTVLKKKPVRTDFVSVFAAAREELGNVVRYVTRSVSFGLLMLCLTLLAIVAYLLSR